MTSLKSFHRLTALLYDIGIRFEYVLSPPRHSVETTIVLLSKMICGIFLSFVFVNRLLRGCLVMLRFLIMGKITRGVYVKPFDSLGFCTLESIYSIIFNPQRSQQFSGPPHLLADLGTFVTTT